MYLLKTIREYPFIRILVFYIAGIVLHHIGGCYWNGMLVFTAILTSFLLLLSMDWFMAKSYFAFQWIPGLLIASCFLLLGFLMASHHSAIPGKPPSNQSYIAVLQENMIAGKTFSRVEIKAYPCDSNGVNTELPYQVLLYVPQHLDSAWLKAGDMILFTATLEPFEEPWFEDDFNYKKFLFYKGIHYRCYLYDQERLTFVAHEKLPLLKMKSILVRDYLLGLLKKAEVPPREYSLMAAMALGYRNGLDDVVKDDFSETGTMHVLAVSGLHVGIIYLLMGSLLGFMDKRKGLFIGKCIFLLFFLWFYAMITGMSVSVIRSVLMFSFIIAGKLLSRRSHAYNPVFASAFILLVYQPFYLFDVGFQLSYAAVLSILFFQPRIFSLFHSKNKLIHYIWGLTSVSLAVQVGVTPLMVFYFHKFSFTFLLANLVAIPASVLILNGLALGFFLFFIPGISGFIIFCTGWVSFFLIEAIHWLGCFRILSWHELHISLHALFLLYAAVLGLMILLKFKRVMGLYALLLFMNLFLINILFVKYQQMKCNDLFVEAREDAYLITFLKEKDQQAYYINTNNKHTKVINKQGDMHSYKKLLSGESLESNHSFYIRKKHHFSYLAVNQLKFLLLETLPKVESYDTLNNVSVDYLMVNKGISIQELQKQHNIRFKNLIVESTTEQNSMQAKTFCKGRNARFIELRKGLKYKLEMNP